MGKGIMSECRGRPSAACDGHLNSAEGPGGELPVAWTRPGTTPQVGYKLASGSYGQLVAVNLYCMVCMKRTSTSVPWLPTFSCRPTHRIPNSARNNHSHESMSVATIHAMFWGPGCRPIVSTGKQFARGGLLTERRIVSAALVTLFHATSGRVKGIACRDQGSRR